MKLKPLVIGGLTAEIPIIQGGMGVGVSLSSLAGAVAKEGGIGIISAAQPGYQEKDFFTNTIEANKRALRYHIKKAKEISGGGIIGVNVMKATQNYAEYVTCCVEAGADMIISGAGLPVDLPEILGDASAKYAPIVSSVKAAKVLLQRWEKRKLRMPDFIVIEGPKAGGHLGFQPEAIQKYETESYDDEVRSIVEYIKTWEEKLNRPMPVIFAGGVYDRGDIDHYIALGCAGVQMATRFVATVECDASEAFKEAYIKAKKEDITIVKSPVGMPGRAIRNSYMARREKEREEVKKCFRCLEHCNPATTPYCISMALIRAVEGDIDNSLVFCGENAYKVNKMSTVHAIMEELNA